MALLQFMTAGLPQVAVPTTVHCDHLIQAQRRRRHRPARALDDQLRGLRVPAHGVGEVRHRLLEARLGHHPPGRARAVRVPRRDDDRHRQPHAQRGRPRHGRDRRRRRRRGRRDGGLAVQRALARSSSASTSPARCRGWAAPKDVILKVAGILTVKGGTGAIVEYFGPGRRVDLGHRQGHDLQHGRARSARPPRCSPTTTDGRDYLKATGREALADLADARARAPAGRPRGRSPTPSAFFDRGHRDRPSTLEPHLVGPHTPDLARPVSRARRRRQATRAGRSRSARALVGSCTNSSYEDIGRAAHIARQARGRRAAR